MFRQNSPLAALRPLFLIALFILSGCQKKPVSPPAAPVSEESAADPTDLPPAIDTPVPTTAPTPPIAPLPELTFAIQSKTHITPSAEPVIEENGVAVQIAPETLADGVEAELTQLTIDPSWQGALEQSYTIDTPFISLAAEGVNDGQGRAMLLLPAPSPDSLLVTVIDNTYLARMDVTPQDGYLTTAVRLGPSSAEDVEQVGSLTPGGSLQYVVLTPRTNATAKSQLSKPVIQDGRSCGIDLDTNFGRITHCRRSAEGTVQVNFLWGIGFSDAEGDQLADAIAGAMTRYGDELGFTAAKLTPRSPMSVVVETRSGDPRYRSLNGVIYLPVDAAQGMIAGATHDTLHEMAHWIQDEEYNMAWAYWSGGKTWWLETAAENMVMLHDPAYIPKNLITYGGITTNDNRLALQQSPYQWPGDFYAHAQLIKLNMCANTAVCPLSEDTFIAAINGGTYPYDNSDARSKLSANLDAYAQYLLGAAPGSGNTAMPLGEPVANGDRYGEYIQIAQTTKSDYNLSFNGIAPQMKKGSDGVGETVVIAATLQKDGVYPLSVISGFNGRNPGLPVKLTIQPGVPLWYRVGKDAPQFHDGSEELIFQPIHLTMGLPGVRLAALGKNGGETFQATLSQIDLQGAWLIVPGEPVNDNITCQDATAAVEDGTVTINASKDLPISLPSILSALGDFRPDAVGNGLTWEWNRNRIPSEAAPYTQSILQFSGAALPAVDKVQLQTKLEWTRATSQAPTQPQWQPLLLGMALVLPGVWGWRRGWKRPYTGPITLILAVFLLVGCFGVGINLWGTVKTDMQFTELEYLGGDSIPTVGVDTMPATPPLWKLRGTADYDVSFYFAGTEDGQDTVVAQCTGTATYNVEAQIFKDIVVNLE